VARVVLVSLYDKGALGARHVSGMLKRAGHEVALVYLKEYNQRLKKHVRGLPDEDLHEGVTPLGEDMVHGITSPVSPVEEDLFLDLLGRLDPAVVGFSLRTCCLRTAQRLTRLVKRRLSVPVIWGSIAPTIDPEWCLPHADALCLGEGEHAMVEYVEAVEAGRDPSDIAGLWLRRDGDAARNPLRPLIQDLDELPYADFDPGGKYLIENGRVSEDPGVANVLGVFEIMTSRGCPHSCAYCCNDALRRLYPRQKYVRRRSVEHVIGELRWAKENLPIRSVNFYDDVFTFNPRWIEEFAPAYQREIGLPFWCFVSPLHAHRPSLERLRDAGLTSVTCGIESGSERILFEVYNRPIKNERVIACAEVLRDLGIFYNFDLITDNPFESDEDCRRTLDLLLRLPRPVRLNYGLSKLSFFPHARITEMLEEQGVPPRPDPVRFAFFNRLYLLAQSRLPRGFIHWLSERGWLRRHPGLLQGFFLPGRARLALLAVARAVGKRILPRRLIHAIKVRFPGLLR